MILAGNVISSASFRDKRKTIFLKNCSGDDVVQLQGKQLFSKDISQIFSSHQRVLENFANFTGKHLCWSLSLIKPEGLQLYLKETPAQMFSCEICYIFKNTYYKEHLRNELLLNFKDKFYVKIKFLKELFHFLTDGLCFFLFNFNDVLTYIFPCPFTLFIAFIAS